MFWAFKITKNADPDKFRYSDYGVGFTINGTLPLSDSSGFNKSVIICGADMGLFAHIINRKKDILILVKGATQGLDNYTMAEERE